MSHELLYIETHVDEKALTHQCSDAIFASDAFRRPPPLSNVYFADIAKYQQQG
jgi:hypothetical protein